MRQKCNVRNPPSTYFDCIVQEEDHHEHMEGLPESEGIPECKATLSSEQLQQAHQFVEDLLQDGGHGSKDVPSDGNITSMYADLSEEQRAAARRDFARGYAATVKDAQQRVAESLK